MFCKSLALIFHQIQIQVQICQKSICYEECWHFWQFMALLSFRYYVKACSSHHQIVLWICFRFVKLRQFIYKYWEGYAVYRPFFLFVLFLISNLCSESHVGTLAYFTLMTIWPLLGSHRIVTMGNQTQGGIGMRHFCCSFHIIIRFVLIFHLTHGGPGKCKKKHLFILRWFGWCSW